MNGPLPNDAPLADLPSFTAFEGVADETNYSPLPDDWHLAVADIVGSTEAIAAGRYKAVNMAGASVIAALLNALGRRDLPFVFGGDGALVAVPDADVPAAREALAATRTWAAEEFDLDLRTAIVPVSDIRDRGLDVRVALYRPSDDVSYAMFAGGGAHWAEEEMKASRYNVAAAAPGSRPDLSGLSCRWNAMSARRGQIVSIIATPVHGTGDERFRELVADIVSIVEEMERGGHPVPEAGPDLHFSAEGVRNELRTVTPAGRVGAFFSIVGQIFLTWVLVMLGKPLGRFDARTYRSDVARNSDFRKFDDGLKMTVDIDAAHLARVEQRLSRGEREGVCRYGLHAQDSALMTCLVSSALERDHMHFIDGAAGGYAMAANKLKAKADA
jgi:hypothetical protein